MTDLLDPSALLETLPKLLPAAPEGPSGDSGSSTSGDAAATASEGWQLRTPQDALAAMAHTIMTRLEFRLINVGEGHRVDASSSATPAGRLPAGWRRHAPDNYTFGYRHEQSSLEFIVKVIKMAGRTMIHATAVEDNKTATYELQTSDYTSASYWPFPSAPPSSSSSAASASEPLVNGFISSSRLKDFVLAYKQLIVQKLVPGLRKDGYDEGPSSAEGTGSGSRPSATRDDRDREREQDGRPYYPGDPVGPRQPNRPPYFDDPVDPSEPSFGRNPLIVGDRDLDPLGMPPRFGGAGGIGGGIGRGGGFGPPPLFGGGDNGGGMIVGPNHPMFRDRFQQPGGIGDGGRAGLPPGAAPPGARYDPVGPFGAGPRFPPPGGAGRGRGRGSGGGAGGEPDWDDMRPPGSVSDEFASI